MISHLVHLDIEDFIVIVIIKFDSTSRVESMKYDEGQHGAHGEDPEYGAIFMSNSATKRECFSRRLFGLPSSQSHFVMQVKYGMILFLFEYEKRQLHGVFRACSDGAMYIEPDAFRKSGKQFPAQVWICISFLCPFGSFFLVLVLAGRRLWEFILSGMIETFSQKFIYLFIN